MYGLDELKRHNRVKLSRSLPDLSHPLFEGYLGCCGRRVGVVSFVFLKGPMLYIFTDEHKVHLRGVVNLGTRTSSGHDTGGGDSNSLPGSKAVRKRAIVTQHKSAVTDVFSVIKGNFDKTTAKLNSMLLMGDEEHQHHHEYKRQEEKRAVLGMVAYQLVRFLVSSSSASAAASGAGGAKEGGEGGGDLDNSEEDAASDAAQAPAPPLHRHKSPTFLPPTPSAEMPAMSSFAMGGLRGHSTRRGPLLSGSQWVTILVESGYAPDETIARHLAKDLFLGGHLIPLSVMGTNVGVLSPMRRRASIITPSSSSMATSPLIRVVRPYYSCSLFTQDLLSLLNLPPPN